VKIGEYDLNLCGGTHVSNTSVIENIYLHKLEGKKIRFYSGKLARKHNQQAVINLHGISREMGVNLGKTYKSVVEMKSKYEGYIKRNRKLKKELTRYQLLSAKWEMVKEISYKLLFSEEMEKGQIMDAIGKLEDGQLVLVITPSNLLILCSNNEILTGKVMDGLRKIGVKGGGRGSMLMGKVTETKGFENKLLDILHSLD
jgi:alanyl-tRNA synthetase